jgi:hypothetical protein
MHRSISGDSYPPTGMSAGAVNQSPAAAEPLPPEPAAEPPGEAGAPPPAEAAEAADIEAAAAEPGAACPWRARVEEALEAADADGLRALLEEGGPGSANHGSGQGDGTLLLNLAVQQNSVGMVRALVECGADPERIDADDEECALHVAAGLLGLQPTFALEALKLMLGSSTTAALDSVRDGEGRTVLHVAVGASKQAAAGAEAQAEAEAAMLGALELLLARGCSVAAVDTGGVAGQGQGDEDAPGVVEGAVTGAGETVLHIAAEWSFPTGLRLLLSSAHASTAALAEDATGARPLDRALTAGRAENARLLLMLMRKALGDHAVPGVATRALGRMCEEAGSHPQRRGARADYAACVRVLIAARADIDRKGGGAGLPKENSRQENSRQGKGRTPLAAAAVGDTPAALVAALLRAGAKRDVTDIDGRCVLLPWVEQLLRTPPPRYRCVYPQPYGGLCAASIRFRLLLPHAHLLLTTAPQPPRCPLAPHNRPPFLPRCPLMLAAADGQPFSPLCIDGWSCLGHPSPAICSSTPPNCSFTSFFPPSPSRQMPSHAGRRSWP